MIKQVTLSNISKLTLFHVQLINKYDIGQDSCVIIEFLLGCCGCKADGM